MIVTGRIAARLAAVIALAVILQVAFFSQLSILGVQPTIVPVVVVSLGLLGGGLIGAVCGFAAGFLLDSVLLATLGVSSLVLLAVGYLAGRYRERFELEGRRTVAALAGGLTLVAATGFAALQLMLGVDAAVSLLVLREIALQALFAVGFAYVVHPAVRWVLAPALIDYVPSRRRLAFAELVRGGIASVGAAAAATRERAARRRPATAERRRQRSARADGSPRRERTSRRGGPERRRPRPDELAAHATEIGSRP